MKRRQAVLVVWGIDTKRHHGSVRRPEQEFERELDDLDPRKVLERLGTRRGAQPAGTEKEGIVQAECDALRFGQGLTVFVRENLVHQVARARRPRNCAAHAHSIQTTLVARVVEPYRLARHLVDERLPYDDAAERAIGIEELGIDFRERALQQRSTRAR
jgi:hypothetical protein